MRRIALAGASGFIGQALTRHFVDAGDDVIAISRSTTTSAGATLTWDPSRGDLDIEKLRALGPIDAVINLAGTGIAERRWTTNRRGEIMTSRTLATRLLAERLSQLDTPPSLVINASAIGFYGDRGEEILNEDSSRGDGFLADVCEQWENAGSLLDENHIPRVSARLGVVLARSGGALAKQLPLFEHGLGGRLGRGDQWMSIIALDEVLRVFDFLLDHKITGAVNCVSLAPVRNRDFTRALATAAGHRAFAAVPRVALSAALGSQLVSEMILASQRVTPGVLQATGFEFTATSLEETLSHALRL